MTIANDSSTDGTTMTTTADWQVIHQELVELAQRRAELDVDEGRALLAAQRAGVHLHLGYGSFHEYVERLFGYGPRFVTERLRVAGALEELPQMQQAMASAELCWSAARELTRVATAQTETAWLRAARGKSVRELEQLVSGLVPGSEPGDRPDPAHRRHIVRFELSAEGYATYREAVAKLQRTTGESLDEDTALLLMARGVLDGPKDDGRADYQIAMTVCPHCGEGQQQGRGEEVAVGAEVVEMAACDAQVLPVSTVPETSVTPPKRATQTIPPAIRREVVRRDDGRCAVPSCRNATFLDVHHLVPRADGGTHDPERMLQLCGCHHRAAHRGTLVIEGSATQGFVFMHADGSPYGGAVLPAVAEAMQDAFLALRHLGFRETAVRQALASVRAQGAAPTDTAEIVRAALQQLTGPSPRAADKPAPTWVSPTAAAPGRREVPGTSEVCEQRAVYYAVPTRAAVTGRAA